MAPVLQNLTHLLSAAFILDVRHGPAFVGAVRAVRAAFPRLRVVWFHQAARRAANATLAARFGLEPVDLAAPLSLATWQGANQALKSAALWATLPRDGHVLMLGGDAGLRAEAARGRGRAHAL